MTGFLVNCREHFSHRLQTHQVLPLENHSSIECITIHTIEYVLNLFIDKNDSFSIQRKDDFKGLEPSQSHLLPDTQKKSIVRLFFFILTTNNTIYRSNPCGYSHITTANVPHVL